MSRDRNFPVRCVFLRPAVDANISGTLLYRCGSVTSTTVLAVGAKVRRQRPGGSLEDLTREGTGGASFDTRWSVMKGFPAY